MGWWLRLGGPYTIRWFPGAEALANGWVGRAKAEAIRTVARLEAEDVLGELERGAWRDPHAVAAELMRMRGVAGGPRTSR